MSLMRPQLPFAAHKDVKGADLTKKAKNTFSVGSERVSEKLALAAIVMRPQTELQIGAKA